MPLANGLRPSALPYFGGALVWTAGEETSPLHSVSVAVSLSNGEIGGRRTAVRPTFSE
jgi:hypothetical protein